MGEKSHGILADDLVFRIEHEFSAAGKNGGSADMVEVEVDRGSDGERADRLAGFGIEHDENAAERDVALIGGDMLTRRDGTPFALTDLVFTLKANACKYGLCRLRGIPHARPDENAGEDKYDDDRRREND